jgi:hypothetical protein
MSVDEAGKNILPFYVNYFMGKLVVSDAGDQTAVYGYISLFDLAIENVDYVGVGYYEIGRFETSRHLDEV